MKRMVFILTIVMGLLAASQAQTIKRQEVINNATAFKNLTWRMNARNVQDQCYSPFWIRTKFGSGATVTGMAYSWGGGSTISDFLSGIAGNGKAGNGCTSVQGNPLGYRSNTFGVDCSGLVTRAWGRAENHLGTSQLENFCSVISSSVTMRMGDIFNKAGDHTVIFSRQAPSGNPMVIEASAIDWKVSEREHPWSYFNGYKRLRYNQLQDGGVAKLNQGISITPLTVRKGQSITLIYHLKELEGSAVTYDTVTCAILDSSNRFMFDLPWVSNFKIPANGEKSYVVASAVINLPPGTYKAVARGRITDWFDFDITGSGVNSKTFTVTR